VGTDATQAFTLTVNEGLAITSANKTTFTVGAAGSFNVTTTGYPAPTCSETGALPSNVAFSGGVLSGTPGPGTGGIYSIIIVCHNGVAADATQAFTLTVNQAPAFTSANATTFAVNTAGSFQVTTTGFPAVASITEAGALPSGSVSFTNNGNGTATLAGTPTTPGVYILTLTASNAAASVQQTFTLTVSGPQVTVSPSSLNFGTLKLGNTLKKSVTVTNHGPSVLTFSRPPISLVATPDSDDFLAASLCPRTLAVGASCVITVQFYADDLGTTSGTLSISDNAVGSPQLVPLTATVVKK
jgi:hypothetical protein